MKRIKKEKLKKIVFDKVISLGGFCQTAYQLERLKLRNEAFPFDWIGCEDNSKLIEAFETNFKDWLLLENLKEEESPSNHRKVIDLYYDTIHQHIFPLNSTIEESYYEVIEKVNRRINRLINLQNKNKSILFVRTNVTLEEAKLLEKVILNKFGEKAYLLIINHTKNKKLKKIETDLSHTYIYEVFEENIDHTSQNWQGYDLHWNKIFENVKIKNINIDLSNDLIFKKFYVCEHDSNMNKIRWSKKKSYINLKKYIGYKCTIKVVSPHSIKFKVKNIINNIIIKECIVGDFEFEIEINRRNSILKLEVDNCWRPCDKYGIEDNRKLGVLIENVQVKKS